MFAVFDRLYQENWLNRLRRKKKGQSNWSIASLCSELVAKMAKDIGMTIRKGIVVSFLPCLVAFFVEEDREATNRSAEIGQAGDRVSPRSPELSRSFSFSPSPLNLDDDELSSAVL